MIRMSKFVLEGNVISGSNIGVFILRLSFTPSNVKILFKFQRRQFPIVVSFVMAINKSQVQPLKKVGAIFVEYCVFAWSVICCNFKGYLQIWIEDAYNE